MKMPVLMKTLFVGLFNCLKQTVSSKLDVGCKKCKYAI